MESNHNISDELLAKYLSGKATPEESEVVLAYLAEHDERVEDFASMVAAVELQRDAEAAMKTRRRTLRRMWVGVSAAAAVVLAVCFFAVRTMQPRSDDGNLVATNADTAAVIVPEQNMPDTLMEEPSVSPANPNWHGLAQKNYAVGDSKSGYCKVVVPKQQEYRISSQQSFFDFSWHTDAEKQLFELKTTSGQVLYSEAADGYVRFSAEDYRQYGHLVWNLKVTFAVDSPWEMGGTIVFE